jgi:hypothetical protein
MFHRLLLKTGLAKEGPAGVRVRIGIFICSTYLTLAVLSLVQGVACTPALREPFLFDIAEACRFLLVGPLLIISDLVVEPWLNHVIKHARDRIIPESQLPEFDNLIASSARWRESYGAEILLLVCTFVWQWAEVRLAAPSAITNWQHQLGSGAPTYAWFWYAYFAKPLIRFLWLRWLWWYFIWSGFLLRLASLKLQIMPAHPDRHGGLAFIEVGHSKFAILALAFGIQVAAVLGQQVVLEGKKFLSFKYEIVELLALSLLIFLPPLLAFTGKLLEAKRTGLFEYGAFAHEFTSGFDAKWIKQKCPENLLGTPDISSLADLGNAYEVVRSMRIVLIGKDTLITFVAAPLLPFAPLLLTVYPFDVWISRFIKAVM